MRCGRGGKVYVYIAGMTVDMKLRSWTAQDIHRGTKVLVRCDFNVPVVRGKVDVSPTGRIARALPEIRKLRKQGAALILVTHLGRPKGIEQKFSVRPIAKALASELGCEVLVADDVAGPSSRALAGDLAPGDVMMLENIRFDAREEENDIAFAKELAALADVYVNNAFGVCHRKHASVVAIAKRLPSFAGELVQNEVKELTKPFAAPFVLVIGGIKLETKLPLLAKLGPQADAILIGSGLVEDVMMPSRELGRALRSLQEKIVVPVDLKRDADRHAFDIGPKAAKQYIAALQGAKTIVWNGPLGIIEKTAGRKGTVAVVRAMAQVKGARTIVGGGETEDFLYEEGLSQSMSWVSTGGGAMLAFLAGEKLPGLQSLANS